MNQLQHLWAITIFLFLTIVLSILLVALNRPLIRFLEGYYLLKKTPLQWHQENIFKNLNENRLRIKGVFLEEMKRHKITPATQKARIETNLKLAKLFPPEDYLLPTSFGNVIRAFETYSSKLYGLDAIPIWPRIILLVPEDQRDLINASKSQVDFAINIIYLTILVILQYLVYISLQKSISNIWIPIIGIIIIYLVYLNAISSAIAWGEDVKAIFDLYRHDLLSKMGIEIPKTWEEERDIWRKISQSLLYQSEFNVARSKQKDDEGTP